MTLVNLWANGRPLQGGTTRIDCLDLSLDVTPVRELSWGKLRALYR